MTSIDIVINSTAAPIAVGTISIGGGGGTCTGDMLKVVYDPTAVNGDAFDVDNHADGTANKVYTATEQTKLGTIEASANNYIHPVNHPPSIIVQDANNRFVTDAEKAAWYSSSSFDGIYSSLTGIPSTFAPEAHYHVEADVTDLDKYTQTEVDNLISAISTPVVTQSVDGLMAATDKVKLDDIESNATADQTGAEIKAAYEAEANTNAYTDAEKTKLSGVADNANNYAHPANHSPSIITQDINNRFVSDAEKTTWDSKADGTHNHDIAYEPKDSNIQAHIIDTENPHGVDKTAVGLSNVDNTSDVNKPISTATQTALEGKVDNSQVLTNVPAGALFTDTIPDYSGTYEPKNINIQTHIGSSANPHAVTKAQVGLDSVDNTSDANKPVSTLQQTALDLKLTAALMSAWALAAIKPTYTAAEVGALAAAILGAANGAASLDADSVVSADEMNLETIIVTGSTTLSAAHNNRKIICNNSSAMNLTIVTQASGSYATKHETIVKSKGVGQVTTVLSSGVTANAIDDTKLDIIIGGSVTITKNVPDNWDLDGAWE